MLIECVLLMALQTTAALPATGYALQPVIYVTKVPKFKRRALKTARIALDIAGAAALSYDAFLTDSGMHNHGTENNPIMRPVAHNKFLLSTAFASEYATGYALGARYPKLAYVVKLASLGSSVFGIRSWYVNNPQVKPPVCWNSRLGVVPC